MDPVLVSFNKQPDNSWVSFVATEPTSSRKYPNHWYETNFAIIYEYSARLKISHFGEFWGLIRQLSSSKMRNLLRDGNTSYKWLNWGTHEPMV